ncbi:MAG TPA: glycosyltransferase family 39 protein [Byssovorax sp.]
MNDPANQPGRRAASTRVTRVVQVACAAVMAFLALQILTFSYGRDQGIYAMVARTVVRGGMPYRDAWDFKPPGIYVVYAIARVLFGGGQVSIRLVEVACLALSAFAMTRIARELWGSTRAGWIAGAVAFAAHAELDFWHTAQPESFGGFATIFAIALVARDLGGGGARAGVERRDLVRWVGAGALCGFAGLLKPPLAGAAPVLAAAIAWRALHRTTEAGARRRAALTPLVAVGAGAVATVSLVAVWFSAKGALGDLVEALFVFAPHYTRLSWEGASIPAMFYAGFTDWLVGYSSVASAGVLLFVVFGRSDGAWPRGAGALLAIIGVQLLGVVLQGKFFPYHYGATWPVTALLAGVGYDRLLARLERFGPAGAAAFFALVAIVAPMRTAVHDLEGTFRERCAARVRLFVTGPRDQEEIDELASVADVNAVANRAVASWLATHTPADRPILVWGFEPVIYDLAGRAPATRYLYDVPQRVAWAKDASRAELMRELAHAPPSAIVVEHRDVFPAVTGDSADSAESLAGFDALRELVAARYQLVQTIEDFDLYVERAGGVVSAPRRGR